MKCKGCGATVIRGQIQCVKCGKYLSDAAEYYDPSKIYRPRLTLYIKALIGAASGRHLDWLGRYDEAERIRQKYHRSLKTELRSSFDFFMGAASLAVGNGKGAARGFSSTISSCILSISAALYGAAESTFILFGKYRSDESGHPIRWFKPDDTPKKKAATAAAGALTVLCCFAFIFGPSLLQQMQDNKESKSDIVSEQIQTASPVETNSAVVTEPLISTEAQVTETETEAVTCAQEEFENESITMADTDADIPLDTEETDYTPAIVISETSTAQVTSAYSPVADETEIFSYEYDEPAYETEWTLMHIIYNHTYIYDSASTEYIPGENHAVYSGDTVEVNGTENGFYYARTADGNGGYIYGYIPCDATAQGAGKSSTDQPLYEVSYVTVTAETANVRSTPDKERSDNLMGVVNKGDTFLVYSYDGYWYEIDYFGTIGYISYKMVT